MNEDIDRCPATSSWTKHCRREAAPIGYRPPQALGWTPQTDYWNPQGGRVPAVSEAAVSRLRSCRIVERRSSSRWRVSTCPRFDDLHRRIRSLRTAWEEGLHHHRIKHHAKVYVDGDVHTRPSRVLRAVSKSGVRGAHHAVSHKGSGLLNEWTWRYNRREDGNRMFRDLIETVP